MKRNYKRDYEFQKKLNERQAEEIESLKLENEKLKTLCEEKDKTINSVEPMRREMTEYISEIKEKRNEYYTLIDELKTMKKVMNKEFFKGRWRLVKFLIK